MSSQQLEQILAISAENPPPQTIDAPQIRQWFEAINEQTPVADGVIIERKSLGTFEAEINRFTDSRPDSLIIYFHGGGFMMGSPRSHRVVSSNLARAGGVPVLSVEYRLAPEHPAPTAHDDAFAAYQWALDQGYAASSIALVGDSAGGNLALATAIRVRDEGLPMPACVALMSPALDLAGEGDSNKSEAGAPLLTRELMGLFNMMYVGDGDLKSPRVTPFYSDLSGLPPVLIHVGSWELLRDDSVTTASRIEAAGGSATLKVWQGMCHSWQLFAPMLDEGMASIEETGAFIQQHFEPNA